MKTFRSILCPIDFDENSLAALDIAVRLAQENDGFLYLLHVDSAPLSRPVFFTAPGGVPSEEASQMKLAKVAREHLEGKVRYRAFVRIGVPFEMINNAAEELGADLVVIATHGRTGPARMFLGSVAEHVVRTCGRPVLTVRSAKPESKKLSADGDPA